MQIAFEAVDERVELELRRGRDAALRERWQQPGDKVMVPPRHRVLSSADDSLVAELGSRQPRCAEDRGEPISEVDRGGRLECRARQTIDFGEQRRLRFGELRAGQDFVDADDAAWTHERATCASVALGSDTNISTSGATTASRRVSMSDRSMSLSTKVTLAIPASRRRPSADAIASPLDADHVTGRADSARKEHCDIAAA